MFCALRKALANAGDDDLVLAGLGGLRLVGLSRGLGRCPGTILRPGGRTEEGCAERQRRSARP